MVWRIVKKICAFIVIMVTVFGVADYFSSNVFYAKATSDIEASAVIGPSATIALSTHNIAFSVLPSVEGTLGKSDALIVSTYTNNDLNCNVTMVADSPNLTYSTYTIPTLEAGTTYTDATFTANSWGYQIENGNYNAVLTESANLIKTVSTMTGSTPDTTSIYFAAKFNTAVKAGNYTNTLTFTSTCAPETRNYMQDQTQASLATLMPNVGDEVTLYDNRDEKAYTVAHLADGNYWMTQNLDHDIVTTPNFYTSQNTDIPSAWTPSAATNPINSGIGNYSSDTPESYDPGSLCWGGTIRSDFNGTISTETVACGSDKHMHIGNYYNWTSAVAMNDSSSYTIQDTDVNQSICPAGWRLPISGTINTGSKSFEYLVAQANLTSGTNGNIQLSPNYFVYTGNLYGSGGAISSDGYYWSSVVGDDYSAYFLYFDAGGYLSPQYGGPRADRYSVRCVARDTVQTHSVTVSMDAGVSSVTFTANNVTQTATSSNSTVSLAQGVSYTITANLETGYQFSGWTSGASGTLTSSSTNPTTYAVTGTTTLSVTSASVAPAKTYMQNISAAALASLMPNVGDEVVLTDNRDEKDYTVAKLADGNYWMTQNLDHNIVAQANYYTPQNTDIPSAWTPNTSTYAASITSWTTVGTVSRSYDPGNRCWNGTFGNYDLNVGTVACGSDKHYHIGNYYNWTAAVAMNNSSSYTTQNVDVGQSICPAGWRLPIGGTANTGSKSFQFLVTQAGLTAGQSGNIHLSPNYFVYGGDWNGSSGLISIIGVYWSSMVYSSDRANTFSFGVDGYLYPQSYGDRSNGYSIRCVAR